MEEEVYKETPYEVDPTEEEQLLIFSDGMQARIVKTVEVTKLTYIFYVVPTDALRVSQGLEEKKQKDIRYDKTNNWYEIEIEKDWCKLLNPHPKFMRWQIFSDWNCKEFIDPFETERPQFVNRIKILEKERNILLTKVNSMQRQQAIDAKNSGRTFEQNIKLMGSLMEQVSPFKQKQGDSSESKG